MLVSGVLVLVLKYEILLWSQCYRWCREGRTKLSIVVKEKSNKQQQNNTQRRQETYSMDHTVWTILRVTQQQMLAELGRSEYRAEQSCVIKDLASISQLLSKHAVVDAVVCLSSDAEGVGGYCSQVRGSNSIKELPALERPVWPAEVFVRPAAQLCPASCSSPPPQGQMLRAPCSFITAHRRSCRHWFSGPTQDGHRFCS